MARDALIEDVRMLSTFLEAGSLTALIAGIEGDLYNATTDEVADIARRRGISRGALGAAVRVRQELGRISDVIHAMAIVLILPFILEEGEVISNRPSLAAGNDPLRPFDLETDRRVAEFKLSNWLGADAARKRQTFKDLVHLAADESGRRPELFIVGDAPLRFLRTTRSTAKWALDRSPTTGALFARRFGPLTMTVAEFTAGPGARVAIRDVSELLPEAARGATPVDEGG